VVTTLTVSLVGIDNRLAKSILELSQKNKYAISIANQDFNKITIPQGKEVLNVIVVHEKEMRRAIKVALKLVAANDKFLNRTCLVVLQSFTPKDAKTPLDTCRSLYTIVEPTVYFKFSHIVKIVMECWSTTHYQGEIIDYLPFGIDRIPMAMRVINESGKVVYVNSRWKCDRERPRTNRFLPFSKSKELRELAGPLPDDTKEGPYRIRSFKCCDDDEHVYQIAESLPLTLHKIEKYKRLVIDSIRHIIDSNDKYLEIVSLPGGLHALSMPTKYKEHTHKRVLLSGELLNFFSAININSINSNDVIFRKIRISSSSQDKCDNYLYNLTIDSSESKEFYAFPVYGKANNSFTLIGVFLFYVNDLNPDSTRDISPEIMGISQTLIYLFRGIALLYKKDIEKMHYDNMKSILELDTVINEATSIDDALKQILIKAVTLTGAFGGLIAWAVDKKTMLEVKATSGKSQEFFLEMRHDLETDLEEMPIMKCWSAKKDVYINRVDRLCRQNLLYAIEKICSNMNITNEKVIESLNQWASGDVSSLCAFIVYSGGQPAGVMSLHFDFEYAFTTDNIRAIGDLLSRTDVFMPLIDAKQYRDSWGMGIAHDMKSKVLQVKGALCYSKEFTLDPKLAKQLTGASSFLASLEDMINDYMDCNNSFSPKINAKFSTTHKMMKDIIKLFSYSCEIRKVDIELKPRSMSSLPWKATLTGDEETVSRIIRNFISNAIKHSPLKSKVRVICEVDETYWTVSVISNSHMSEEAYKLRFVPHVKPLAENTDGAHIGLSVAQNIVKAYGGKLLVENISKNEPKGVLSKLAWPLFKTGVINV